jgi:hypothetical protein
MKRLLSVLCLSTILATQISTVAQADSSTPLQRNLLRWKGVREILRSVLEYETDTGDLPVEITSISTEIGSGVAAVDLCPYLVPTYSHLIGWDPLNEGSYYVDCTDYSSGYTISVDSTGTVTVSAPYAELGRAISISGN